MKDSEIIDKLDRINTDHNIMTALVNNIPKLDADIAKDIRAAYMVKWRKFSDELPERKRSISVLYRDKQNRGVLIQNLILGVEFGGRPALLTSDMGVYAYLENVRSETDPTIWTYTNELNLPE